MVASSVQVSQLQRALRGRVELNWPLAPHTSYRIGGPADLALFPADRADLIRAVQLLDELACEWVVLGGGSNVLISDRGVRGAVLFTSALRELEVVGMQLTAGAGVASHDVAEHARAAGLSGAEFLAWLPGSVGGAALMNARAYGGEMSEVLCRAATVTPQGELRMHVLAPQQFGYKRSPFQGTGEVIVEATLQLQPGEPAEIAARMEHIEERRRANRERDYPSCGCVFKNDHQLGIPSGQLIERCGLKGYRVGDAQVSPQHANFIINLGHATASDVWQVIEAVRRQVAERTGHTLELEVRRLGEWETP